jgi:flagellar biosynthetic protein FliP
VPIALHWNGSSWQRTVFNAAPNDGVGSKAVAALSSTQVYAMGSVIARWTGGALGQRMTLLLIPSGGICIVPVDGRFPPHRRLEWSFPMEQTSTGPDAIAVEAPGRRAPAAGALRFARHYVEMVVAMVVGMMVLGAAVGAGASALGVSYSRATHPEWGSVEMATTMSIGMVAWMLFRGHGWPSILEMTAAMYVAAAVAIVGLWLGLSAGAASVVMHVLMLPLMALAMLRRRSEYTAPHERPEATLAAESRDHWAARQPGRASSKIISQ